MVAGEPQQQVALHRPVEALVEAPDVLDGVASQERGREVDRAPAEQLVARPADSAGAGHHGGRPAVVGVRQQVAEHLGQPLAPERQERHVLAGAVLEGHVEGAGEPAPRLAHDGDAVVEGRHALQHGRGVVDRPAVDGDEVPVGEGLRLQRRHRLVHERSGVLGGHHDGHRRGGARAVAGSAGVGPTSCGRSRTTSSRHSVAAAMAAAR